MFSNRGRVLKKEKMRPTKPVHVNKRWSNLFSRDQNEISISKVFFFFWPLMFSDQSLRAVFPLRMMCLTIREQNCKSFVQMKCRNEKKFLLNLIYQISIGGITVLIISGFDLATVQCWRLNRSIKTRQNSITQHS